MHEKGLLWQLSQTVKSPKLKFQTVSEKINLAYTYPILSTMPLHKLDTQTWHSRVPHKKSLILTLNKTKFQQLQ